MIRIVQSFYVVALATAAAVLGGCSSAGRPTTGADSHSEPVGSVGLELEAAPGIVIDAVTYTIHNPAALTSDLTGTVDVSHSQVARFLIGGLPVADGYTIALFATTQDGLACIGDPAEFSIVAGQTSDVETNLVCGPATAGGADSGSALVTATVSLADGESPCPVVTSLSALPSEVDVGGALLLSAAASAGDAVLAWSATGSAGALDLASGPGNTFRCTAPGVATVTVTATLAGTGCSSAASVDLTCDAPADASLACVSGNLGLGGVGLPPGTTVTTSDGSSVATEGPLGVGWAANDWSGWIQFSFPVPVALDGVALAAVSLPTTEETYTLTGFLQGAAIPLGSYADTVITGFDVSLPPMLFSPGLFDGLRIDVNGELTWVSVPAESLLTADCPAGPGGIYDIGTGARVDDGTSDAGAAEASADAGESTDAGGSDDATESTDAGEASVGGDSDGTAASACSTVDDGLGGIGVPAGTVATSDAGSSTPPSAAIDGLVGTGWGPTGNSNATLTLNFPEPVTFTGVGLNVSAGSPTFFLVSFTGLLGGTQTAIGTYENTRSAIPGGINLDIPAIPFPSPVTYDGLIIVFAAPTLTVNEVSLINPGCPPGPGGSFVTGTGVPIDAGASSGTGQDAGIPEAGACELPPFPFFGTAELTGTLATLSSQSLQPPCGPLGTPAASQGTVTFSVGSAGCSFVYTDSSGAEYASNLLSRISSAGDTVSCSVSPGNGLQAPLAYGPCPELTGHLDGLDTNVVFSVTRSTGAVSISRLCAWSDAVCFGSLAPYDLFGPATSLQLSGSVTCPDGGNLTGVVQCGFGDCSTPGQSCCRSVDPQSLGASCAATANPNCAPGFSPGVAVGCDGPESCPPGFVCCPAQAGTAISVPTCQALSCPSQGF